MEFQAGVVVNRGRESWKKDLCDLLETRRKMVRGGKPAVDVLLQNLGMRTEQ